MKASVLSLILFKDISVCITTEDMVVKVNDLSYRGNYEAKVFRKNNHYLVKCHPEITFYQNLLILP